MAAVIELAIMDYTGITVTRERSYSRSAPGTQINENEITDPGYTKLREDTDLQFERKTEEYTSQPQERVGGAPAPAVTQVPTSGITRSGIMVATSSGQRGQVSRRARLAFPVIEDEPETEHILRSHFVKPLLADLQRIQKSCGTPLVATYASRLFRTMRAMRDLLPSDTYLDVVLALHDAMAFQNRWGDYTAEQYQGAYQVLKKFARRRRLRSGEVGKAIVEMERLGFDTTPFDIDNYDEC